MPEPFRWGILGPGNIAKKFATGLQAIPDAELAAVGSRTQEKADAFAKEFGAKRAFGSYQELIADPGVDAIYIATPHPMHEGDALACLAGGKAVLCEKPFAINAAQAKRVIDDSRQRKIFVMEAMWTRFFPLMREVRKMVSEGVIGEARMIQADFGFRAGFNPASRLFDPNLGGGALLDVGIYPASFCSFLFGTPEKVAGFAHLGETGVDEEAAAIFAYPGGRLATFTTAVRLNTPHEAWVLGTEGKIKIHAPWWVPTAMTLSVSGKEDQKIDFPITGNGYNFQAVEVADCVRAGKTESAFMPLDETLSIMKTLDNLRAQWGQKYPME